MTAPTLLKLLAFVPVLVAVIGFWVTRPKRRVVEPPEPPYPAPPGMCWIYDALDASVFTGELVSDPENRKGFADYLDRWNRAVQEAEAREANPAQRKPEAPVTPIYTVADIRKAIDGRADDELVHAQIVAADGTTWNMAAVIAPVFQCDRGLVIDMRHPQLKTLPTD